MLHKNFYYLKNTSEYKLVSQKGKTIKSSLLVAKFAPKDTLNKERYQEDKPVFGITVSKKIGNAVVRNLLRRRIKAILQTKEFSVNTSNYVFSFYARVPARTTRFTILKKEVDKILKNV